MNRFRQDPARTVRLTIAGLVAISAVLLIAAFGQHSMAFEPLPILGLAALFLLGERMAFHLPSRRGAHTLTVVELAAIVGVALMSPATYVLGRMLGSAASLVGLRRQRGARLWFNLANTLLGGAIGAAAISLFDIHNRELAEVWPLVFATVSFEALVLGLPVAFVISVHEPDRPVSAIVRELRVSWIASLSVAAIGIVFLVLVVELPGLAAIAAFLGIAVIVSMASYAELYSSRQELEGVAALTSRTAVASGVEALSESILAASTELLRSDRGVLIVPDEGAGAVVVRTHGDTISSVERCALATELLTLISGLRSVEVLAPGHPTAAALFDPEMNESTAVVPLSLSGRPLGLIALGAPSAPATTYSDADLRLLETLAWHSATALSRVLLEERLRREIDEKARIIRSKDQLIAAVSHELRTPLTGILGFAEMLRDDHISLESESSRDITGTIADEALDLSYIVEDLLTAARHELGALSYHCTQLDLAETVERSLPVVERKHDRTFGRRVASVTAVYDGPRVRQIVRNLAANAVRYGGDSIEVVVADHGTRAAFVIRDNGDGIPEERATSVFDPYQSAHEPGTQPGSVGLGLTISREMARAMGGDLTHRRVDGWTEFALWLPTGSQESSNEAEATVLAT